MRYLSEHRIEFMMENKDLEEIPAVINPIHIYEVGEVFKYFDLVPVEGKVDEEKEVIRFFKVVGRTNEVIFPGEQLFILTIKEVERQV